MSAANTSQLPPAIAVSPAQVNMWDDTSVELNEQRLRLNVPTLPSVDRPTQVIHGGGTETLAYLALQILKSQDKDVIMRSIASASSILLRDRSNLTGSSTAPIALTGLDRDTLSQMAGHDELRTNFEDAETVTNDELMDLMAADPDELGAYFGVLFLAGNKPVTSRNRTAFNERRQSSALASTIGEAIIFVADSVFLSDIILKKVYATFLSRSPMRANMTSRIVQHISKPHMGPALAFMSMFLLLADFGMGALRMIKEAVIKHPWIRSEFAEIKPELQAANKAQQVLRHVAGEERSFLKAIHGNNFVPVNYSQIDNLTGICKEVLKRTVPSYQNYEGGKVTEDQLAKINRILGVQAAVPTTGVVTAE
jgi:hypothetical protein